MADDMLSPDEWAPPPAERPHDHKGHSEEKCVRCGWVMGHRPLNCMNDDTPHRFPSQEAEIERLRAAEEARITNLRLLNEANAKLSRLRAAGDALAEAHVDDLCDCGQSECVAIRDAHAAWEEARRG